MFPLRLIRYFSNKSLINCWRCGLNHDSSFLFCMKCKSLQRPDNSKNYFDIFGIKQEFTVKSKDLSNTFRKLQSQLHPDKFSNKDQKEKVISEEYSSLVNKAYSTLSQPLLRGLYLLELKGEIIEEKNVQDNKKFLMTIMELNEKVDSAQDEETLNKIGKNNTYKLETLAKKVGEAFDTGNIKSAKATLIEMKYYASVDSKIRLIRQTKGWEDK